MQSGWAVAESDCPLNAIRRRPGSAPTSSTNGRGRAATRTGGRPAELPRVVRRPEQCGLTRRQHPELAGVGLAEDGHSSGAQAHDQLLVAARHVVAEEAGPFGETNAGTLGGEVL